MTTTTVRYYHNKIHKMTWFPALIFLQFIFCLHAQEWPLEAPVGKKVQLTFQSFDIEDHASCIYDYVEVSYGSYSERFCGTSIPGPFTSTGRTLTVRIHTDDSVVKGGFSAVWTPYPSGYILKYFDLKVNILTNLQWPGPKFNLVLTFSYFKLLPDLMPIVIVCHGRWMNNISTPSLPTHAAALSREWPGYGGRRAGDLPLQRGELGRVRLQVLGPGGVPRLDLAPRHQELRHPGRQPRAGRAVRGRLGGPPLLCSTLIHRGCRRWCQNWSKLRIATFCLFSDQVISRNNLVSTIPTWGPSFRISMDLYINSFDGANLKNGKLAELLRFTNTNSNCCAIGDRIPAIFTDKRGFIQVATQIGNAGNKWRNVRLSKKAWHRLDILQYFWNNKVNRSGSVSPDSLILPSLLLYFFIIVVSL